jgi:signal transduction histidine kinase/ActR/RegA family two-component response regulator
MKVTTAPGLPFHRRLETQVALGVTLVVFFALGAALLIATRVVTSGSLERASSDLAAARSAFYRLEDDRAESASAQAALVTTLPVFRAYLTDSRLAGDLASLQVLADEYRQQLNAAFCIVTGKNGGSRAGKAAAWGASSGWQPGTAPPQAIAAMIATAAAGQPRRGIAEAGERLYLVVSEPARFAEETLGTLTVGYALDDALARQLAQITHTDVNILLGSGLVASSLTGGNRAAMANLPAAGPLASFGDAARIERVGSGEYVAGAFPLSMGMGPDGPGRLLLLQDWAPVQRYLDQLQRELFAAGGVIFVLALACGVVFARRISRPLTDMAAAAGDIAGGNWERQVPVRGSAEATSLSLAFNTMTTSLRHWYEEAKKRDDELRQAQKMEAIGRLAGGVAHDFNNLLTAIRGYAELSILDLADRQDVVPQLAEIVSAADRAADLTRQLLAFSRRQIVAPRVLALDRVVTGMHQLVRRVIGEDVQVVIAIDSTIGLVRADRTQIEQVIINLVVNARDAMPNGGTVTIALANTPGNHICLTISDTGHGMDEQTVARIFEPFFTTKETGRGTGLGLAIVYGIIQQAGGTVTVDTTVGKGTAFHILLPRLPDDTPADPEIDLTRGLAALRKGSETVLLVEDDDRLIVLISNTLRQAGYTVLAASRGEEALQIARTHRAPIHLLLTDVVMPGMNGRVLSEQLRMFHPYTSILFMSGYSDDAVLLHGIETDSAQYIQKPFSMDALMAKMRETLLQSRAPGSFSPGRA